ncbi:MAG: DUF4166 domain-containing protein [Arenimonas sp.]
MKILIIGGYGTFGGRLAELLSEVEALTLLIAGRSEEKASKFIGKLPAGAKKRPLAFDRDADVDKQISAIKPDLVVDATGPFQLYGDDPYRVVKACLKHNANYMDLADGVQFVNGIDQFDAEARARNLFVLSGVSTFPVLSAAAIRQLAFDMDKVTDIKGGIAPSPYAGVGLNVLRAIAGYAGKPVEIVRGGRRVKSYALTDSFDYTIAPPAYLPLRRRCFSLMDVPDISLLPKFWPDLDSMWMGAAPEPAIFHTAFRWLAWLVRLRLLPTLSPLASLFHFVSRTFRWGEHRGGMFISVRGTQGHGEIIERSWHLVAEGDNGPYIPSMAIEGIIRRSLQSIKPRAGARACVDDLDLGDYEALLKTRDIHTGIRELSAQTKSHSLYQKTLGNGWHLLPKELQEIHASAGDLNASGEACVERGKGLLPGLIATLFGFPRPAKNIPVTVSFKSCGNVELWQRTFGHKSFCSTQTHGSTTGLLSERFGPFAFDLALVIRDGKLMFMVRDWYFLGIHMPRALAPGGNSFEFSEAGRFNFHIEVAHPLLGLIVRYRGWLVPTRQ